MTPHGINPERIHQNTPAAARRRWLAQQLTVWVGVVLFIVLPIILGAHIEGLTS